MSTGTHAEYTLHEMRPYFSVVNKFQRSPALVFLGHESAYAPITTFLFLRYSYSAMSRHRRADILGVSEILCDESCSVNTFTTISKHRTEQQPMGIQEVMKCNCRHVQRIPESSLHYHDLFGLGSKGKMKAQ